MAPSLDWHDLSHTRVRLTFLLSYRQGTSTYNTSIPKITYADASKAKDAWLADTLLQGFCALAV
jgi:hypothetical protein